MKVYIDKMICIGCGMCSAIEPIVFDMDEDGKAKVIQEVTEETKETVQEAIDSCPVGAIKEQL